MNRLKVLVADDHRLTRSALKNIFAVASDIEVVAEAADAGEVFQKMKSTNPDVIVLDVNMPGKDGLEILKQLRTEGNNTPVVVLTLFPPERFKAAAMSAGAASFLSKDCNPEDLLDAVRKAASG
jgi:DNA-binding NarL/FixJ family response regulator